MLLCFDVDGTLLDSQTHRVPASAKEALRLLKARGHHIIVSTGRAYDSLKRTEIFAIAPWDGFVLNNGQMIMDARENILEKHVMKVSSVRKTIDIADALNLAVTLKKDERLITRKPDEYVYATQRYFNNVIPPFGVYNNKDDVYAMVIYGPMGYDYAPFMDIPGVRVAPGVGCYADATIAGVSKATGCQSFMHRFGYEDYVAFGDSQNDLEMFKYAKVAVCMGDGDPVALEAATYITDGIREDGIASACRKLGYVRKRGHVSGIRKGRLQK